MITCAHQVTCILLCTDSCTIECMIRITTARMPSRVTGAFYLLVHVFVWNQRYFSPCPIWIACACMNLCDCRYVHHVLIIWCTCDMPTCFATEVLNKLVTTRQPYNFCSWHVPPVWIPKLDYGCKSYRMLVDRYRWLYGRSIICTYICMVGNRSNIGSKK